MKPALPRFFAVGATDSARLSRAKSTIVAIVLGVLAALYSHHMMSSSGRPGADDFTYYWLAARSVLAGDSPYRTVLPGGPYQLTAGFLYPLPAALLVLPFSAFIPPTAAASAFVGISSSLLAWGIARTNSAQLALFGGVQFFWAVSSGQLITLVTAGALIPWLSWVAFAKPNIALAVFAYRPSKGMILAGVAFFLFSLMIQPHWPQDWIDAIRSRTVGNYLLPLRVTGGPLLLASILRWRRPEGRLLLVMSCVPQSMLFYDQLILGLVPKTWNESMLLVISGFAGYMFSSWHLPENATPATASQIYGPAILLSLYLPCLIMILRRPNEGIFARSLLPIGDPLIVQQSVRKASV